MRLTKQDMEIRRNRIIHVAYKLFIQYGIEGVSIAKIAKDSGVGPKTIFRYFENKAQLVEQTQRILWKEIVDCITSDSEQALAKAINGLEEMKVLLQGFQRLYQEHSDYLLFSYGYQSYLIRNHTKLSKSHLEKMLSDVRPIFLHALDRGQKDGSISASHPAQEQFMFIWAIMYAYIDKLVIHTQLYEGENAWSIMFPELTYRIIQVLKPEESILKK